MIPLYNDPLDRSSSDTSTSNESPAGTLSEIQTLSDEDIFEFIDLSDTDARAASIEQGLSPLPKRDFDEPVLKEVPALSLDLARKSIQRLDDALGDSPAAGTGAQTDDGSIWFEQWLGHDPFHNISLGTYLSPVFLDLDGDDILDLVTGTFSGSLQFYQGDHAGDYNPSGAANPFGDVWVNFIAAPAFVDLDGDGDLDMAVGARDGTITAFRNGTRGESGDFNAWGSTFPFTGIDVGQAAAPAFTDMDGDGDLDMVVGNGAGDLISFRNGGNGWSGAFRTWGENDLFADLTVNQGSTPTWVDLDGDGDMDLVVGTRYGEITSFINGGTGWRGIFRPWGDDDPFRDVDVELRSAPTFADLDYDGDLDMINGSAYGGLYIYENRSGNASEFDFAAEETFIASDDLSF